MIPIAYDLKPLPPVVYRGPVLAQRELFADLKNRDLYWEALVQIGKNNKKEAQGWAAAIHSNQPVMGLHPWKEVHPAQIDDFFDRLFVLSMVRDPIGLSYLGLFESIGLRDHNAYLNDISYETAQWNLDQAKINLASIKQYSTKGLSWDQQISYQTFSWLLEHTVEGEQFLYHSYPVTQMFGAIQELTTVFMVFHQLEVAQDVKLYLARLGQIPAYLNQVIEKMTEQQKRGVVPPRFAVEKSIQMIRKFTAAAPKENIFYQQLAAKIEAIDLPKKADDLFRAETLISKKVYPAYQKMERFLTELLEVAKENQGVWALPNGGDYYTYLLSQYTTTDMSADEVHELGLSEVARIQEEMRALLAAEGIVDPDKEVSQLMQQLAADPKYYFADSEEGREECLAEFRAILERSRKELWPFFDIKPKAKVIVQAVPKHEEDGAPGAYYYPPSIDGSRPGIFNVNLSHMEEITKYSMETLAVHEAEPGHHFQCSLQNEIDLPTLRKLGGYTAYVEGWALYTEKLAYEKGFYSSNAAKLGHLEAELMRAARLVLDTGIHKKRWTREQAIDYMETATGIPHETVVGEVERYFVLPGQACAYKIGQLKILALRQKAMDALGDRFDLRDFHNVVLKTAAVPLTILEKCVDHYISMQK